MTEREYDRLHNEGGEGYNPIRAKREAAESEALRQRMLQSMQQTPEGRIAALHRRIELECGSVARGWGDNNKIDALRADLYAQIAAIRLESDAEFLAIWTPEETTRRRNEWNARVKSGEFTLRNGKVDGGKMYQAINNQGWRLEDLKKAVKLNNL